MYDKAANPHIWESEIGEYLAFLTETINLLLKELLINFVLINLSINRLII